MIALRYKHYLAVSPLTSQKHNPVVGSRLARPNRSCIQIWSLSPSQPEGVPNLDEDPGVMRCEMIVCIEAGSALELKWCPLPSHDNLSVRVPPGLFYIGFLHNVMQAPFDPASPLRKIGVIAGTFEDGSVSLYAVPDPVDLANRTGNTGNDKPIFGGPVITSIICSGGILITYLHPVRLTEPLLRLQLEDTSAYCLDWANSDVLAVGCSNGSCVAKRPITLLTWITGWVAVYDVGNLLRSGEKGLDKCE